MHSNTSDASGWHSVSFYGSIAFGLEIPSHSVAVAGILPSVTPSHEVFFTQHLAVEQPRSGGQIDERNQVREQQELPKQDKPECDIHWIAASRILSHSGTADAFKTTFEVFPRVGPDNSLEGLTERSVGLIAHRPGNVDELFVAPFK
jgi:hypothetical protein